MNSDDGAAFTPAGAKACRKSGKVALDGEAVFFQKVAEQAGCFMLLHAQFAKIEDAVIEQRDLLRVLVKIVEGESLFGARGFLRHCLIRHSGLPVAAFLIAPA